MSADGEIEIAVQAEGAEDAAADLADADAGGGGGGGGVAAGGGGDGGLRSALKGGIIGGLLSQALGPLLDVLSPILEILNAFLAPVAVLLLRLLQPVLRFFIQLLPAWIRFTEQVPGLIDQAKNFIRTLPRRINRFLRQLPGMIWTAFSNGASWLANGAAQIGKMVWREIRAGASWIANGAVAIGEAVWNATTTTLGDLVDELTSIPGEIARIIQNAVPSLTGSGDGDTGVLDNPNNPFFQAGQETSDTLISLEGGLESFVENVEQSDVDFIP